MKDSFEHSIQYPKPLDNDDLQYLIDVATSGKFFLPQMFFLEKYQAKKLFL